MVHPVSEHSGEIVELTRVRQGLAAPNGTRVRDVDGCAFGVVIGFRTCSLAFQFTCRGEAHDCAELAEREQFRCFVGPLFILIGAFSF